MNPSILLPETAAITAQAVASRSLAGYFINNPPEQGSPPDVPFNNSTKYQVFIPYKWDSLNYATDPLPPTEPNPCAGNQGNQAQRLACGAIESGSLIAQHGTTLSAKALFFSDVMGKTATAEKPYLTSVEDPISDCDIYAAAHAWGMSQRGAIRWAKGNQCAGSGDQPWPVRWTDYRQILAHYYTGIDFLNDSVSTGSTTVAAKIAPDDRWNLLHHDAPQEMPLGNYYDNYHLVTLTIQNTSTTDWSAGEISLGQPARSSPFDAAICPYNW